MIKIYLDISQTYHKDIPDEEMAKRLASLVKYILEDKIPLDTVEKAVQSLNWSEETQRIITDAANLAYDKMQEEIKDYPSGMDVIPEYGNHMSLGEFIDNCQDGSFIDYDGYGQYATQDKMSDIVIKPSDVTKNKINKKFTHVVWFNR